MLDMPTLPLDHTLPLVATIGVMLYPGTDEEDRRRAAAYAAHFRNKAYRQLRDAGVPLTPKMEEELAEEDELPRDLKKRWFAGVAMGNMLKVLFGLMQNEPDLASWNHAAAIVSKAYEGTGFPKSRAYLWAVRRRFFPVAPLWAAHCIRDGKFIHAPESGYGLDTDFQYFLWEAELLGQCGRSYYQDRDKAEPFLPRDSWHVPYDWPGPEYNPCFQEASEARLRYANVPDLIKGLRSGGRPMMAPSVDLI
ncbi:hypothetical protein [Mesorhizobium sp. KR9-304]|uniref:hypothetical protein n=1 Tax=Mesorhizobium sp. KR9-304 TaxID=3156614 RepID=UPI0032B42713